MKMLHAYATAVLALLIVLSFSPEALAQYNPDREAAITRCEPLPPAGNPQVAKIFSQRLVLPGVCPTGQFPRRYGSGRDLPDYEACVDIQSDNQKVPTGRPSPHPMTDPEGAKQYAELLNKVEPCPPGMRWQLRIDPNTPPSPSGPLEYKKKQSLLNDESTQKFGDMDRSQAGWIITTDYEPCKEDVLPAPYNLTSYHCHQAMTQDTSESGASGASGTFSVEKPFVAGTSDFSLAQIAIDGETGTATVEFGWKVARYFRDLNPHLFVEYS